MISFWMRKPEINYHKLFVISVVEDGKVIYVMHNAEQSTPSRTRLIKPALYSRETQNIILFSFETLAADLTWTITSLPSSAFNSCYGWVSLYRRNVGLIFECEYSERSWDTEWRKESIRWCILVTCRQGNFVWAEVVMKWYVSATKWWQCFISNWKPRSRSGWKRAWRNKTLKADCWVILGGGVKFS